MEQQITKTKTFNKFLAYSTKIIKHTLKDHQIHTTTRQRFRAAQS